MEDYLVTKHIDYTVKEYLVKMNLTFWVHM